LRQFEVPQWLDDVNELLKKILAEAKGASGLDHPNIARLNTCGYKGFTVFMTAEFVEGQSLKELMASRSPDLAEILPWARQLCAALDYAHDKGVFHHFLDSSNIKILADGTLKVLDFGLVKDKHLLSQTPAKRLENEPYLSPEQVKNKPPDRAANLFSAATILYELYTGRNPFSGMHLGEVDRGITEVNPHPLNTANARVPVAISTVVLKALSKAPGERYPTGKQFVDALEEAMKGDPVRLSAGTKTARATGMGTPKPAVASATEPLQQTFQEMPSNGTGTVTATAKPAARPAAPAKVQVRSLSQWKLVAAVAACLIVVALLAFLFQPRSKDVVESTEVPPAQSSQQGKSPAAAPPAVIPAAQTEAVASEPLEPIEATPHGATKRGGRASHSVAKAISSAAAPAPASAVEGQIAVSSVPADATVEIEGLSGQTWKTPQTIGSLAPGAYKLTVSKLGYSPEVRTVQVSAGSRMPLTVQLTVVKGFLNIGGSPAGASVMIDGKDTGRVTPAAFVLEPAVHNVVLRKAGFLEAGSDIRLAAGQTVGYSPSLMVAGRTDNIKIMGGGVGKLFGGNGSSGRARIEIRTEPKGAEVVINGTALQKTTPVEIQVEPGSYDITLQKDGYQPVHENAIVGVDDRVRINKPLSR
jgi:hypothetical protein